LLKKSSFRRIFAGDGCPGGARRALARGSWTGRKLLARPPEKAFTLVVEGLLIVSGLVLITGRR
jgi:hypothetical protein